MNYDYDDIYGCTLTEYCEAHQTTLDEIIKKIKIDIEILSSNLEIQINAKLPYPESYIVTKVYNTIGKKQKHLARLLDWQAEEYSSVYDDVKRIINLQKDVQDNWDGQGGKAPTLDAIQGSMHFVELMQNTGIASPKLQITSAGNIILYWQEKKILVEFIFAEAGFTEAYTLDKVDYETILDNIKIEKNSLAPVFTELKKTLSLGISSLGK